jgi:hypothetical protein
MYPLYSVRNNLPNIYTREVKLRYEVKDSSGLRSFVTAHQEVKTLILGHFFYLSIYCMNVECLEIEYSSDLHGIGFSMSGY